MSNSPRQSANVSESAVWKLWIDTGGTFTDCLATTPEGVLKRLKVLSSSILRVKVIEKTGPSSYRVQFPMVFERDFLKGFKFTIGKHTAKVESVVGDEVFLNKRFTPVAGATTAELTSGEEVPVFAARLLTETGLHETFPAIDLKLGSTRGTNALLERKGARLALLVTRGFKDLLLIGNQQRKDLFNLQVEKASPLYDVVLEVEERVAADGSVLQGISKKQVAELIAVLKKKKVAAVAVALMNSYINPAHEEMLEAELQQAGMGYVSVSHQLSKQIKILPRAETSVVNAYLDPIMHAYVNNIAKGLGTDAFFVMSSAGRLLRASGFYPKDSLLSGPAGGVIGGLLKAQAAGTDDIITFDMGGTSTDVSLCQGRPDYQYVCTVGASTILSPSLAIETIAAGGGSICSFDGYQLKVGPESAGASPGPACYGAGGPLTITDVNLLLGRLDEDNFSIPLHRHAAEDRLTALVRKVEKATRRKPSPSEVLAALAAIANEKMAEAIRKVSIQRGYDTKDYALLCFGGAGGQHTCALATVLGVERIIVPYDAGLLSAYGIGQARVGRLSETLVMQPLAAVKSRLKGMLNTLFKEGKAALEAEGFSPQQIRRGEQFLFLRLQGQETSLEVPYVNEAEDAIESAFKARYEKIYGHWLEDRVIELESIRVAAQVRQPAEKQSNKAYKVYEPSFYKEQEMYAAGTWRRHGVYRWESLMPGAQIAGPALVISQNSTLYVDAGWLFTLDGQQNAILNRREEPSKQVSVSVEEARLALFTNRFTAIAQDMGAMLQRTAFSVNVKERLDFSCALLDGAGRLIVNAPHIPVHLGSLGVCVRAVIKQLDMAEGDVVMTNHPAYGGSHLPDITLIKAVYYKKKRVGFVANRAHHAEIGGKKPGSMPADATQLAEEGVVIEPRYFMRKGVVAWAETEALLSTGPWPSRAVHENMADLNGALAALQQGEEALQQLCEKYGAADVCHYMDGLYAQAADAMKKTIATLPVKGYRATERLDDGSVLKVQLMPVRGRLLIDFTGTSPVHKGNLNATQAIVNSVVLYVLRLLINEPLPLNEGLLKHVKLTIPKGMLNPTFYKDHTRSPAVVGGNTEVSQRLTDTLLKALGLAACSQGTMNNVLFGNDRFGYYETICGGTGAGKGFLGADAVHQHMTNTRITDPEIMEHRYPVRLLQFAVRRRSGGSGKWRGGDGIVRELLFLEKLAVNILSQHRHEAPYGMKGGAPGKTGSQYIIRANGRREALAGVAGTAVAPGDRLVVHTPGGGGWGKHG